MQPAESGIGFEMIEEHGIGAAIESISPFTDVESMNDKFLNTFMTIGGIDYGFSKESLAHRSDSDGSQISKSSLA